MILRVPRHDVRVGCREVQQREQPGVVNQAVGAIRRHEERDAVPMELRAIGPEETDLRLFGGVSRTGVFAQSFDFIEVSRLLGARERRGPRRSKLARRVHHERFHAGQLWSLSRQIARRGWPPLTRRSSACEGRKDRVGAVAAARRENFIGDLLSPSDSLLIRSRLSPAIASNEASS